MVEAIKVEAVGDVFEFCGIDNVTAPLKGKIGIVTLEGTMNVSPGDYVIKGVNGEFYPCKSDIFEKTYEPV